MKRQDDIIIVGAGIAGLTLGLLLTRSGAGYRITILDRRRGIHPVLKPEILQPRGLEILSELGVLDALLQEPIQRCEAFNFYRMGGSLLCRTDYRVLRHPYPYTVIAFPHITQKVLLERLREYENVEIHWGTEVQDLIRSGDQVVGVRAVTHGQDQEFLASVVVGTDGKQSKVRQLMGVPYQVHQYPDAFIAMPIERPKEFGSEGRYYLGRRSILGLFPASVTALCAVYMVPYPYLTSLPMQDLNRLKEAIRRIDPVVGESLKSVTSWDQVDRFVCMRVKAHRWVADGAALLGDAAHAVFPHVAQGSTQAMEDARVLTQVLDTCFQHGDFTAQALSPYEQARSAPVARLQRLADEYVWLWNTGNPILTRLRDRIFTHIGRNERLMYKTIANEAGLRAEPLTWRERMQALAGVW